MKTYIYNEAKYHALKLIKQKESQQRKIKRKYWKTKGIVESSENFRLNLQKRYNLKHMSQKK